MADFEKAIGELKQGNVGVVALSVDPIAEALKTKERQSITFPLAYGVNGPEFAAQTGAFFDERKGFLHATGFLLQPDGRLAAALYSTGAVGRYTATDLIALLDYLRKKPH